MIAKLEEFFKLSSGSTKPKDIIKLPDNVNKYPVFGGNGIIGYSGNFNTEGDNIIVGRVGENCGCVYIYSDKCWITDNALYTAKRRNSYNPLFMYYLLHNLGLKRYRAKGGQPLVTQSSIHNIKVNVPSKLSEQKYIAETLRVWDTAIEKTEALIAAKERRFGWLVKNLISSPKNTENHKRIKLKEIGDISSAGVDKKIVEGEEDVVLLNYLDVYGRDKIWACELGHRVTAPRSKVNKCSIERGDIFFTPSSETRVDIGHSAVAMEDVKEGVYSYHIIRLRPEIDVDLLYSAYAFKGRGFYKQMAKYADGSGQRYVVSQNNFRKIEILLPPVEEQKCIAETLNAARLEIDLLKKLGEKYREQKHGLMQKLLTTH